jgi:hypothetical protein
VADKQPAKAKSEREGDAKQPDQAGQCAKEEANKIAVGIWDRTI